MPAIARTDRYEVEGRIISLKNPFQARRTSRSVRLVIGGIVQVFEGGVATRNTGARAQRTSGSVIRWRADPARETRAATTPLKLTASQSNSRPLRESRCSGATARPARTSRATKREGQTCARGRAPLHQGPPTPLCSGACLTRRERGFGRAISLEISRSGLSGWAGSAPETGAATTPYGVTTRTGRRLPASSNR